MAGIVVSGVGVGVGVAVGAGRPVALEPTEQVRPSALRSIELKPLSEPVDLLAELRELAPERPATARAVAPELLAEYATALWSDDLDSAGIPEAVVVHAFATCRREIWLWIEGDRRWDQLAGYLSARVIRRAPIL
ncbi:MAG TPA: hypothetical protein VKA05_02730 [Acidimicrobiales bacterium]|nr:hypothetical protein [Acidimicrobiales bacterium]